MRSRAAVVVVLAGAVGLMLFNAVFAPAAGDLVALVVPATFLAVGAVVGLRQPDNPEAMLLLVTGVAWAVALAVPLDGSWVIPVALMTIHLLLRFPDGRLPSPRWRAFSWFCIVMPVVVAFVVTSSSEVTMDGAPNPYYLSWAHQLNGLIALLPVAMVISAVSLVVRYRHADAVERLQVRWLAFAGAWVVGWYGLTLVASLVYDWKVGIDRTQSSWFGDGYPAWLLVLQTSTLLSFILIPVAFGVAILRYRLYDIDRIVSRTTSYALATGILIGVYVLVVTAISWLLPLSSTLPVAVATLTAAALFRPLLVRTRRAVDRRFDREHFSAERVIQEFSLHLVHEVDPDVVTSELLRAVDETVQPASVGLWLPGTRS